MSESIEEKRGERSESRISKDSVILCSQCKSVPYVSILQINPIKLKIQCYFCGENKDVLASSLEEGTTKDLEQNNCHTHKENKNKFYCITCQGHICPSCQGHEDHDKIELSHLVNIKEITNKINKAKTYLSSYYEKLKNKCIGNIENDIQKLEKKIEGLKNDIKKVEEISQSNQKINEDLLKFVQVLVSNYNENNYYTIINMRNFDHFNLRKVGSNPSTQEMIEFYKTNCIMNTKKKRYVFYKEPTKNFPLEIVDVVKNTSVRSIKGFSTGVLSACLIDERRIAACSGNCNKIKVFDIYSGSCIMEIPGHRATISCLCKLESGNIASGSFESVKVWEIGEEKYRCIKTFEAHSHFSVNKIIPLVNDRIVTCADDMMINVWKGSGNFELIKNLFPLCSSIPSIVELRNKKHFVSGGGDLFFWNSETYNCDYTIKDCPCSFSDAIVELENNKLIVGGFFGVLNIVDLTNFQVEKRLENYYLNDFYCFSQFKDGTILCGNNAGSIYQFDCSVYEFINHKKTCHQKAISSLIKLDEKTVITSSFDGLIKIWNFKIV